MAKTTTKKTSTRPSLRQELTLGALVAELLASAALTVVALMLSNNPIVAALAVVVLILVFTEVSGAYINPAVVASAWALRQITWVKALGFVVVQVLGAMLAYVIISKFVADTGMYTLFTPAEQIQAMAQSYGGMENVPQEQVRAAGEWKPIWGELVGAIIFGFGVASALLTKKLGFDRAFTIGGALMLGLFAAMAGSHAVLNPAVATALSAFAQGGWWSVAAYAVAPLVGAAAGAWLFRLLKQDVDNTAKKAL